MKHETIKQFYPDPQKMAEYAENYIKTFKPDDIADENSNLCVIVDTLHHEGHGFDGVKHLAYEFEIDDNIENEWITEEITKTADDIADYLNNSLKNVTGGFYFAWDDGSYYLYYSRPKDTTEKK